MKCMPCPKNTFSMDKRTAKCLPCGHGTYARKGSKRCTAACKFWPEQMAAQDEAKRMNAGDTVANSNTKRIMYKVLSLSLPPSMFALYLPLSLFPLCLPSLFALY